MYKYIIGAIAITGAIVVSVRKKKAIAVWRETDRAGVLRAYQQA